MKIRNGFVSNSSSSSFVILGKRLSKKEENTFKDLDPDNEDWMYDVDGVDIIYDGENDRIFAGHIIECSDGDALYGVEKNIDEFIDSNKISKLREIISYKGPLKIITGTRSV